MDASVNQVLEDAIRSDPCLRTSKLVAHSNRGADETSRLEYI